MASKHQHTDEVTRKPKATRKPLNHTLLAMALREFVTGPTSRQELVEVTGLSYNTVCDLVATLHAAKLIYIAAVEYNGTTLIQFFQFGPDKPDVRYRKKTNAQCQRDARARRAGVFAGSTRTAALRPRRRTDTPPPVQP